MNLMLDANIVFDHIGRREPFYELSRKVCLLGITGDAQTYITTNMATDIYYILKKDFGGIKAQKMIEEDLGFLKQIAVTPGDVADALARKWEDFEDCLISCCAQKANIDYIITRNLKDFSRSNIKALSPGQLFEEFAARGIVYEEIDF